MRSTEILSKIGQDISRVLYNNSVSLEVLNDPKSPCKDKELNTAQITVRQDMHDLIQSNRELLTILHLAIKDFPISTRELDDVEELMQPDELGELPRPIEPVDQYFSQVDTNQMNKPSYDDGENINGIPPFIWKRMKGDLNNDCNNN